ncbi:MAG TPA: sigma-70 family RNA polymerase sigma factor [Clostridiales bacterium]|jgi:RNA polymerase sporulation-specific sigma factor|nr:sigma-70 family RNA polymerase sigma factor [Clostridiales bacterium]
MSQKNNPDKTAVLGLIAEVKKGDQAAFDRLLGLYEPMIRSTVSQFAKDKHDAEDLRQEALAVFYRAILTFDTKQPGVEFGLYAKICVTNALITQARAARRRAGNTVASLEYSDYFRYRAEDDNPAGLIIERENEKALRRFIEKNLSKYENRVFTLYISGLTSAEISQRLSRPEKSVDNALYRIKRKLRTLLEKNGHM